MSLRGRLLIIGGLIGVGSLIYFLLRKPKFKIVNIFWDKDTGIYSFGGVEKEFSRNSGKLVNDAYVIEYKLKSNDKFNSDVYLNILTSIDRKKTIFSLVDNNNNVIQKLTIDWFSKLKY
jgi:hypothetical protein